MDRARARTDNGEVTVSIEDLKEYADRRNNLHRGQNTSRPLSQNYELVGLAGEWQFALEFGMVMDLTERVNGDGKVDFHTPIGTIDVKTARKAYNLLIEVNRPHADILVLAAYDDETGEAELLGWESYQEMRRAPYKDFGYGIVNHYKSVSALRSMDELKTFLGGYK